MKHLDIEQIIEFVSMDASDRAAVEASCFVNAHLATCALCRDRIRAAQSLYDAMLQECRSRAIAKGKLARDFSER